jgi:flagellar motor switch protein FliM
VSELQGQVLTREELDALLASLAEESREREAAERPSGPFRRDVKRSVGRSGSALPALGRVLEQWAVDRGRSLSTTYQTPITCVLASWESVTQGELAETVLPEDRIAVFELGPPRSHGFLLPSRALLFAQLCLAFGSRPAGARAPAPTREYTRIEKRFLRFLCEQTLASLQDVWQDVVPARAQLVAVDEPQRLLDDAHETVLLASFELEGLAEFARLRLALPMAPFQRLQTAPKVVSAAPQRSDLAPAVLDTAVQLRVEVGSAELRLSELGRLQVGSVIPITPADDDALIVRVEGRPKFRAIRGTVGRRLAVQLTGRV